MEVKKNLNGSLTKVENSLQNGSLTKVENSLQAAFGV